jgi:beta-mannosidase
MTGRVLRIGGHQRVELNTGWELCDATAAAGDWLRIGAPGSVADILRREGLWSIDGPARDFDASEWLFRTEFDAPSADADRWVLRFDGLATLAEVTLNDVHVLSSDNMFMSHEIPVGHLMRPQGNRLQLRFLPLAAHLGQRRPRPRWRTPMLQQQQLRWVRTTLLGRTPGWSPPVAGVGPWQGVWLEARTGVELGALRLRPHVQGSDGLLSLSCRLVTLGAAEIDKVLAVLSRAGREYSGALTGSGAAYAGTVSVPGVDLWWPHTHGEPCLYELRLRILLEGCREFVEVEVGALGFRTLHWRTDGDDFALAVNGVPVFCRGACWTPLDPVTLHGPAQAYAPAVAQVRHSGMNMLRVSGAMVYESDAFYDACDAQGVLVWQDLMFANMDYPADAAFIDSVRQEVTQQLERWQARPSVALVCGNSEGEQQAAMWGAPRAQWSQELFSAELPRLVAEVAADLAYWPSSAHGGAFPFQANAGTASYYGVGAYLRPLADARSSGLRFASECLGFANIPEPSTLARLPGGATKVHQAGWKARSPRDLGAGWDFDDVRDHYLREVYGIDASALRACDHERYLMLGRTVTGDVMAEAFAQWRAADASCRGALVWFLRDLWAGAGWGLLDDAGQPKACWWLLRRMLQPLHLALTNQGLNGLYLHLENERPHVVDAQLCVAAFRDGHIELMRAEVPMALGPRRRITRPLSSLFDEFTDLSHAYRFGPRGHDVVAAVLRDADNRVLSQAVCWFDHGALLAGTELGLSAVVRELGDGGAELTVGSERAARGVHVDIPGWQADDNYFDLLPGDRRVIRLSVISGALARGIGGRVMALNARMPVLVRPAT